MSFDHYYMEVGRWERVKLNFLPSNNFHIVMLTVTEEILRICCTKTATTVGISKTARIEYLGSRTVDGDKKKELPVHYKRYDMEANPRQKLQAECFVRVFSSNFVPRIDFHMVMIAVVDDMLTLCFATTVIREPVFIMWLYSIAWWLEGRWRQDKTLTRSL